MAPESGDWLGAADARRFSGLLVGPDAVAELRAMVLGGAGRDLIVSGYFNEPDKLVAAAAQLDGEARGVYVTLNPVNPALLARANNRLVRAPKHATSDAEITRRRILLIDCDPVRPSGVSATDNEKAAAVTLAAGIKAFLAALGFPEPIEGDSGNGSHLNYAIDLPADDGGLVQRFLQALAFRFDTDQAKVDTSVHNPARISKLYGTMVRKGDSTPDRPHRRSSIISSPEHLVPVSDELLQSVAAMLPSAQPRTAPHTVAANEGLDIDAILARRGIVVARRGSWNGGTRWVFEVCPFNSDHLNGSAYLVQFPSGALAAGCHHNSCQGNGWPELRQVLGITFPAPGGELRGAERRKRRRVSVMPYRPFPVDVLPDPVRRFVVSSSQAIGCDPAFIILPVLSAIAAAIGNTHRIRLKRGWSEPAILWTSLIGFSGTLKSPAFEIALRVVRRMQDLAMRDFKEVRKAFLKELRKYEKALAKWKRAAAEVDPPTPPDEPHAERYVCSDVTVEALAVLLLHQLRGLLLARDEISGWLGAFNQYKGGRGGDVAHWLEMHSAVSMIVDRKTGDPRTIHVPHAAVSITGGIQPRVLARCLGEEHFEDGLAARFLLAYPPRQPKRWTEAEVDPAVVREIEGLFEELYSLKLTVEDDGAVVPKEIDLSPEAKRIWIAFYNEHGREQAELGGNLCAAWAKLEGYAARLALVVHFIRWGGRDPSIQDQVDEHSIRAGITLSRWFGEEAKRVYALLAESDEDQELRDRLDLIERRDGVVSVRDWQQSRSFATAEEAEADLEALVADGLGKWEYAPTGRKGGRPSKRFRLIPASGEAETSAGEEPSGDLSVSERVDCPAARAAPNTILEVERSTEGPSPQRPESQLPEQSASTDSSESDTDKTPAPSDPCGVSGPGTPEIVGPDEVIL